jgi:tetratricopeptide (TPR) repeat protein
VLARAHLRLADALYRSSVRESAVEHAAAAYETALDAQIPDLAVVAASRAMLAAYDLPGEQWLRWRRHAEAALQQTDAIHPRAVFASRMSIALEREGKYLEALEEAERAIELTQQLAADPATADPRRADIAHQQRGLVLWRLGRLEEAEAVMREVLASRSERYAATSPNLAPLRHQLAIVLREKGQVEAALELVEANYDAERRALPAGHPDIVISLGLLAALERELERYDDAEVHLQAAAEMLRADSPAMLRASVWIGWSNVFVDTDRLAEAEAKLMGARTVLDAEGDAAWHARATVLLNLTELHRLQADQVRALQDLGGALELLCPHLPRARCEQAEAVVRTAREAVAAGDAEAAERIHEAVASLRELGPRP